MKTIPLLVALLSLGQVSSQSPERAFERARLIEEKEGDLRAAETAWRELLAMADLPPTVANGANLRLGRLLWSLDRKDEARPFLEHVIAKGDAQAAAAAQAVLDGKWDPARQAELRQQAEELVQRLGLIILGKDESPVRYEAWERTTKALRALGADGATALADRLRFSWPALCGATKALAPQDLPNFAKAEIALVAELWRVGTPPATEYFEAVLAHDTPALRELMVPSQRCTADLLPIAVRFLHDAAPDGGVGRAARPIAGVLPKEGVLELLRATPPQARAAGYLGARALWRRTRPEEQPALLTELLPFLDRGLPDGDEDVHAEAWQLAGLLWESKPRPVLTPLLRHLASASPHPVLTEQHPASLDDAELQLLHAAGKSLSTKARDWRHGWIDQLVGLHRPEWTKGFPLLFELLADYGRQSRTNWVSALPLATPAERNQLIRMVNGLAGGGTILTALDKLGVTADAVPAIRDAYADARDGHGLHELLIQLAGRTRSAEAATWLVELSPRVPAHLHHNLVHALVRLSFDGVGDPVPTELRRLLVAEFPDRQVRRGLILAELTRRGDTEVFPLLGKAVELGLGDSDGHPAQASIPVPTQLNCLADAPMSRATEQTPPKRWSGYSDTQFVQAWRTILNDPTTRAAAVAQSSRGEAPLVPALAARALLEIMPTTDDRFRSQLPWFGACLQTLTQDQLRADEGLAAALRTALAGPHPEATLQLLSDELVRAREAELRQLAADTRRPALFLTRLGTAGAALSAADWVAILQQGDIDLAHPISRLPPVVDAPVRLAIENLLQCTYQGNRLAACEALGRYAARESVAPLLATLRDESPTIREAATKALEKIRFYQDQLAHWQQTGNGPTVTREHAASKLVAQAQPTNPKERRLLAIRSLALLQAPETLPFLIDWTTDADGDIAQAARDACARLHQQGATATAGDARK